MNNNPDFLSGHTSSLIYWQDLPASAYGSFISGRQQDCAKARLHNTRVTEEALYLAELIQQSRRSVRRLSHKERQLRAWKICSALMVLLSVFFQVSSEDLRNARRGSKHVARIRQFGMYIAHTMFGLSMTEVAYAFCRERTTVKHACHLIEDMRENENFDRRVSAFEYLIRALYPCEGEREND